MPALAAGLRVRGYVSTAWGCPYEGAVDPRTRGAIRRCGCSPSAATRCRSATPSGWARRPDAARSSTSSCTGRAPGRIAMHMHDTRGTALANVLVGLEGGVTTFDASVGGLGGCPYAPGASGNLATEDLVYMLRGMGVDTGVDLGKLVSAGELAQRLVGRRRCPERRSRPSSPPEPRAAERAKTEAR